MDLSIAKPFPVISLSSSFEILSRSTAPTIYIFLHAIHDPGIYLSRNSARLQDRLLLLVVGGQETQHLQSFYDQPLNGSYAEIETKDRNASLDQEMAKEKIERNVP